MVYIKLLEPSMRPYLPTFWKMDLEEASLIRHCSLRRTRVTSYDAQEIPDEFYGEARLLLRYLKGQPKLGRWYPRDSPFNLEAFSNSDYAGVSLDRKSTTGGVDPTP
ncbi:hypothetical protein Tco_1040706 [Tanacetum coccineum]